MFKPYDYFITPEDFEMAKKNGVKPNTLIARIRRYGWSKEKAIHTPPIKKNNRGRWAKIAEQNGIKYGTFLARITCRGMSEEEAATRPVKIGRPRKYPEKWVEEAKRNGISYETFLARIKKGMSFEEAATKPLMSKSEAGRIGKRKSMESTRTIKEEKHRILQQIGKLIDEHNDTNAPYANCPGCSICDNITKLRKLLERMQNQRIKRILKKGENMTKEELRYLLSKDVDRKVIARSLNISTQTLQKYLKRWQLSKRQMG